MRKLLDEYKQKLEDFVAQREDLILLAVCSEQDYGFVLQLLREMEQSSDADVYLVFSDPFENVQQYLDITIQRLEDQLDVANELLAELGKDPWPGLPSSLRDSSLPPSRRLIESIDFSKNLMPSGEHRLIWAMFPMEVHDWPAFLELTGGLAPRERIEPWMRMTRVILRAPRDWQEKQSRIRGAPRVRAAEIGIGPEEFQNELARQVEDGELDLDQRMNSLVSLAVIDFGHKRLPEAREKYMHVLGHYQETENKTMEAFVYNGLGDVARREENLEEARTWYECAIKPAGEGQSGVVLSTVLRNLGEISYEEKKFDEAETYFSNLDELTKSTLDPECKAKALEWKGKSQEKQGKIDQAIETWNVAVGFCIEIGIDDDLEANAGHLRRVFRSRGDEHRIREMEARIEAGPQNKPEES